MYLLTQHLYVYVCTVFCIFNNIANVLFVIVKDVIMVIHTAVTELKYTHMYVCRIGRNFHSIKILCKP